MRARVLLRARALFTKSSRARRFCISTTRRNSIINGLWCAFLSIMLYFIDDTIFDFHLRGNQNDHFGFPPSGKSILDWRLRLQSLFATFGANRIVFISTFGEINAVAFGNRLCWPYRPTLFRFAKQISVGWKWISYLLGAWKSISTNRFRILNQNVGLTGQLVCHLRGKPHLRLKASPSIAVVYFSLGAKNKQQDRV